jgi:hypothetical protein
MDDMLGLLNAVSNMPGGSISHSNVSKGSLGEQLEYTDLSDSSPKDNATTLNDKDVVSPDITSWSPREENVAAEGQDEIRNKINFQASRKMQTRVYMMDVNHIQSFLS